MPANNHLCRQHNCNYPEGATCPKCEAEMAKIRSQIIESINYILTNNGFSRIEPDVDLVYLTLRKGSWPEVVTRSDIKRVNNNG